MNRKYISIIKYGNDANAESYLKAIKRRLGEEYVEVYDLEGMTVKDLAYIVCESYEIPYLVLEPFPRGIKADLFNHDLESKGKYPITPTAIFNNLKNMTNLKGKTVCILNRTERIGRPLANMLMDAGATVTVCNSKTDEGYLSDIIQYSDIVISATNGKETFRPIPNQIVVDVSNDLAKYKNETNRFKYISTSVVGRWTLEELERRLSDV